MTSIHTVIREEIIRLSRREARRVAVDFRKSRAQVRRTLADLKRRCRALETECRRLQQQARKTAVASVDTRNVDGRDVARIRTTTRMIKALRAKLGLSQADFGKLIGVTAQAVYLWERRSGKLRLRTATKKALLAVRGIGRREARRRLADAAGR